MNTDHLRARRQHRPRRAAPGDCAAHRGHDPRLAQGRLPSQRGTRRTMAVPPGPQQPGIRRIQGGWPLLPRSVHHLSGGTGRMSAEPVGQRNVDLLRAVHDQHAIALRSYVIGLTHGDRGKAQDVVQETLLRAWRNPAVLDDRRLRTTLAVHRRQAHRHRRMALGTSTARSDHRHLSRAGGHRHGAADRGPPTRAYRTTDAVHRTPSGVAGVLLPRRIRRRGSPDSWRTTGHHQVPHPLRAPRAETGCRPWFG